MAVAPTTWGRLPYSNTTQGARNWTTLVISADDLLA
jgi:hypothetical protein